MDFNSDSPDNYLETEVLTATPQKLQLMMINGALRFAFQAKQMREQQEPELAWEKLLRCREIVAQILCSIKPDGSDLMRNVAGIYLFLFQELTDIHSQDAYARLDGVISVLNEERQTWEELCHQMPEAPERPREEVREITASDAEAILNQAETLLHQAEQDEPPRSLPPSYGLDSDANYYPGSQGGISFDA